MVNRLSANTRPLPFVFAINLLLQRVAKTELYFSFLLYQIIYNIIDFIFRFLINPVSICDITRLLANIIFSPSVAGLPVTSICDLRCSVSQISNVICSNIPKINYKTKSDKSLAFPNRVDRCTRNLRNVP